MKVLNIDEVKQLDELISLEVDFINEKFNKSEELGRFCLSNSLKSFKTMYLRKRYGEILPQFSSEYRYLVVGILKNINDEFQEAALSELISPQMHDLSIEDIAELIRNPKNS